jgi:murein DD-endopeptidase MepM/ murein hydrolase activator NlpD
MRRPIPTGWQDYLDRTYPYGSTSGGQYLPHNGGDFQNPVSTPVVAVSGGTIVFAGSDSDALYGPQLDFYGNLIVMQVDACAYGGRPVYALYGHLSEVLVEVGQQVATGDTIGAVGGTGIAAGGAHLHFEVRVDNPNDYFTSTRNPDLWIQPYGGYGTLAGRVTDAEGNYLPDVTIRIDRLESDDLPRYAYTYTSSENRPDDKWGENFTYGDLPEGWYSVATGSGVYREEVYIRPGETSWVEFVFGQ